MPIVEHNGKTYNVNDKGFLSNFQDWDEDLADYVRACEGLPELRDEHYKAVDALRSYYQKNKDVPPTRLMSTVTGLPLKRIYDLFPSGPGQGACRMAGLQGDC